jgi:hypothetical protein
MRFETALEKHARNSPLHVLASLDLVIAVDNTGKVTDIVEIALADEGYALKPLFMSSEIVSALKPVAAPSFVTEMSTVGQHTLASDLKYAAGAGNFRPSPGVEMKPAIDYDMQPPGWELDQLNEDFEQSSTSLSEDDALMAATYGLAPPPKPRGG